MRESVRNFAVGITSIVALVALAGLLMSFGELDRFFNPRYVVAIQTDSAAGLRNGSAVEYNGVPIGSVGDIRIATDPSYPVRIICLINQGVRLPSNVQFSSATQLIGGSARLEFFAPPLPPDAQPTYLPTDGSAALVGPMHGGMLDEITRQLDLRMQPLLDSLQRFNELADVYADLGRSLSTMVTPQTPEQIASGEQPNLRTAVTRLYDVLEQARESLQVATEFLGDEQVQADTRNAIRKANVLIDHATAAISRYSQLADSLQTDAHTVAARILPVVDQLGTTLAEVQRLSQLATQGQGTVGQLLNNPELYNSLNDAARRLEEALRDMRLLIQKLREEGVNVNF